MGGRNGNGNALVFTVGERAGKRGQFTILRLPRRINGERMVLVRCDCGNVRWLRTYYVRKYKTCGEGHTNPRLAELRAAREARYAEQRRIRVEFNERKRMEAIEAKRVSPKTV